MNLVSISTVKKKEEIDNFIEKFNLNVGGSIRVLCRIELND